MKVRIGLGVVFSLLAVTAHAATVHPGVPELVETDGSVTCVVPATFPVAGVPKQVLFLASSGGISVKWENRASKVIWPRAMLTGGEQRPNGVYLASNFGVFLSPDGNSARFYSPARFSLVNPFGWAMDSNGLWNLSPGGAFSQANLPIAPWRNVTGFAIWTNYLYGTNVLWVGAAAGFNYTKGLYQAVVVRGRSYPTYGIPDYQNVTAVCGLSGGLDLVYDHLIFWQRDASNPSAPFTEAPLPADNYALQSLRYGPNDIDAVAYVGRTLWLNLESEAPASVVFPGTIRYVANDADRRALIVSTTAGVFSLPYSLS